MSKISFDELANTIADEIERTLNNTNPTELSYQVYCRALVEKLRELFDMADKREAPIDEQFVEMSFGEVIYGVIEEIQCADSCRDWYERDHPRSLAEHYRREVHNRIHSIWLPAFERVELKKALIEMVDSGKMAALLKG
jgi:hypothetical protein